MLRDLRLACRLLWQRPAFMAAAVLTLAIGMGVNTVAFTVVNGLLFQGPLSSAGTGLVRVLTTPGGDEAGNGSLPDYERFVEATRGSLDLAAEGRSTIAWHRGGATETAWVLYVTANYFSMIDVAPVAGRIAVARAAGAAPSAVIGERFWREKLASRPVAGLSLRLNGTDVDVAGVLPESYTGPAGIYSPDVWLPLEDVALFRTTPALQARETRWLFFLGRLQPGSGAAEVQGRLDTAAALMARDWPDTHHDRGARLQALGGGSERRSVATAAGIGMGLIGLVLLLACFNVANLLLARAVERERDMGIRAALGAGPGRLVRQVLAEGFVVAALSGALAIVLARWTGTLVGSFAIPIDQPQHINLAPDATVVLFVAVLVTVAGVLPGLWPALAAARVNVVRALGSQGAGSAGGRPSRLRAWLVTAQVAGSTAFLAIAALLAQSFSHLGGVDLGFDRDHLVIAEFAPSGQGYDAAAAERYAEAFLARVRSLPGVSDAAVIDRAPFFIGFNRMTRVWPDGRPCDGGECPSFPTLAAGPGYFRTMGIALSAGREFPPGGAAGEVIVNQSFARQQWPDGRGIGETIRVGDRGEIFTVVGITTTHQTRGLDRERPTLYFALGAREYEGAVTLVARTAAAPAALVRPVREAAGEVDADVPLLAVKTMERQAAMQLWPFRTMSWLFSICGALALVLATAGLAGVVIHAVNRRRREFGVRISMGATRRDLMRDVLKGGAALLVPGLIAGIVLAAGAARLLQFMFFGVNVLNPLTYLAVALVECAVVIAACLAPALRAARVDPLTALRAE